jgi:hypothetical protein
MSSPKVSDLMPMIADGAVKEILRYCFDELKLSLGCARVALLSANRLADAMEMIAESKALQGNIKVSGTPTSTDSRQPEAAASRT